MTGSTFTRDDAARLAALLNGLRPDWYIAETTKALGEAARRPDRPDAYQIAVAAIRCAANPNNGTPARIPLPGHHWHPWPDEPIPTPTPPRAVTCKRCGAYVTEPWAEHEAACQRRASSDTYRTGAAAARAALDAARQAQEETT